MFSMTKSRELDEVQSEDGDVNKRHYGEDVKFYEVQSEDGDVNKRHYGEDVKFYHLYE